MYRSPETLIKLTGTKLKYKKKQKKRTSKEGGLGNSGSKDKSDWRIYVNWDKFIKYLWWRYDYRLSVTDQDLELFNALLGEAELVTNYPYHLHVLQVLVLGLYFTLFTKNKRILAAGVRMRIEALLILNSLHAYLSTNRMSTGQSQWISQVL